MYRALMLVAAIDGVVFGLGSLLVPETILSVFGGETDDLGLATIRQQGGIILGYGIVAWFLREVDAGPLRRGVIAGVVVSFAFTALIAALITTSGLINALGWVIVVIHAAVAIGLVWVLLRPRASR